MTEEENLGGKNKKIKLEDEREGGRDRDGGGRKRMGLPQGITTCSATIHVDEDISLCVSVEVNVSGRSCDCWRRVKPSLYPLYQLQSVIYHHVSITRLSPCFALLCQPWLSLVTFIFVVNSMDKLTPVS